MGTPAICTEGLSKRYGSANALPGLNLEVAQGEVVGYLGLNGAGKTTAIRLLLGPPACPSQTSLQNHGVVEFSVVLHR